MPDFLLLAKAVLLAAVLAGLVLVVVARTTTSPAPWRLAVGWIGGLAAGIYAGCALLGEWPRWPPLEDRDRFLTILLPLALAMEFAAMLIPQRRGLRWILRITMAAAAAPILLHNSAYVADLSGPGSAEWSPPQAVLIISLCAALLVIVWAFLLQLQSRISGQTLSSVLVATALASAATVMLSGYYRGGLLALPISGALGGATLASRAFSKQPLENPHMGVGILGIFSVLLVGRFYGSLPTSLGICLFLAPLLLWVGEIPRIRKLPAAALAAVRIGTVLAALILIVACAQARFLASAASRSDIRR